MTGRRPSSRSPRAAGGCRSSAARASVRAAAIRPAGCRGQNRSCAEEQRAQPFGTSRVEIPSSLMLRRTICNLDSMNQSSLLNAREAAARLGVKLDTLYAYVSRGLLRSVAVPGSRERHYRPEDVERFRAARRSGAESGAEPGGMPAMPPIDSAICLIEGGRLYYRGQDAIRLSDTASLEEIAALLWGADGGPAAEPLKAGGGAAARKLDPIARCQI